MSASDAIPVPRKNTAFRFYFAIRKPSDSTLITTWAGMDSEVSLDGAAFADCTNEATEIGTSGCGYIDLTSSEMNADSVVLKVTVTNTGAVPLVFTFYPETAGDYRVDSSNSSVGSVSGAVGSVTGAVGSVTGNVGGNVTGSTASVVGAVGSVTGNLGGNVNGNVVGTVASVVGNVGGNVSGNVSGSVGSVAGAVGSVTGSVGSVVGSVGGSVASVAGAVGSVTGNLGGDVAGKVLGGGSGTISGDGVRAASVTGAVGSVTGSVGSVVGAVVLNTEGRTAIADAVDTKLSDTHGDGSWGGGGGSGGGSPVFTAVVVARIATGSAAGWPEDFTIGDAYLTENAGAQPLFIKDVADNILSGLGTKNFSDPDFVGALRLAPLTDGTRTLDTPPTTIEVKSTDDVGIVYNDDTAGAEYFELQIPRAKTLMGVTKTKYSCQFIMNWGIDNTFERTVNLGEIKFLRKNAPAT